MHRVTFLPMLLAKPGISLLEKTSNDYLVTVLENLTCREKTST